MADLDLCAGVKGENTDGGEAAKRSLKDGVEQWFLGFEVHHNYWGFLIQAQLECDSSQVSR